MGTRARPNGSVSGHQVLKRELKEMLEGVVAPEGSGVHKQFIYKVPEKIREANPKAYTPRVVSIGPFHHKPRGSGGDLEPMEELKLKYLTAFLNRTHLCVDDFVLELEKWEDTIQNCYAGPVNYESNDFLKMIIIDACFIIEHFLRCYDYQEWKEMDPLLLKPWLRHDIHHDLILLENQLPFFVLQEIYNLAYRDYFPSLLDITFCYFRGSNPQKIKPNSVSPKHFTDLLRTFLLPTSLDQGETKEWEAVEHVYIAIQLSEAGLEFEVSEQSNMNPERVRPKCFTDLLRTFMLPSSSNLAETKEGDAVEHVHSASQLSEVGLEFKVNKQGTCLLDIEYHEGVLTMPRLIVHDETETYFRNVLAFEECHLPADSAYFSQYLSILDFLINTERDVNILIDKKIIANWMGDANSVATMVNNLCKNVSMPPLNSKYHSICQSLNGFYENPRNKHWAIFKNEYCNTPWKKASTIAAASLLLLTLIQTICSFWSLVKG